MLLTFVIKHTRINDVKCHCGCPVQLLSLLQACPTLSTTVFQTDSNSCFAFQYCGNWRKRMIFNSPTSWTGSPGYTHPPSTVHRTRILSPNIASIASLTASVDSHHSLKVYWQRKSDSGLPFLFLKNLGHLCSNF